MSSFLTRHSEIMDLFPSHIASQRRLKDEDALVYLQNWVLTNRRIPKAKTPNREENRLSVYITKNAEARAWVKTLPPKEFGVRKRLNGRQPDPTPAIILQGEAHRPPLKIRTQ